MSLKVAKSRLLEKSLEEFLMRQRRGGGGAGGTGRGSKNTTAFCGRKIGGIDRGEKKKSKRVIEKNTGKSRKEKSLKLGGEVRDLLVRRDGCQWRRGC